MNKYDYLILGNGIAGISAAEEIRKNDSDGSIGVISEESISTYHRPRLSHSLTKELDPETILVKKANWYEINNITQFLGVKVLSIQFDSSLVKTSNGEFEYNKLLISTGSKPFVPNITGIDSLKVDSLRNYEDLKRINHNISDKDNITIIGCGVLGIEAAVSIVESGKKVRMIEFAPYIMPRQLDNESSEILRKYLFEDNIEIVTNTAIQRVVESDEKLILMTSDGKKFETDYVLLSTGISPETSYLNKENLNINRGIVVDHFMKTSRKNVFAAGDVAEFEGRVIGLWKPSSDMGKCAGQNMVINDSKMLLLDFPFTMVNLSRTKIFSIGNFSDSDRVLKIKTSNESSSKIFIKDSRISGVILIGDTSKMLHLKKLVENSHKLSDEKLDLSDEKLFELILSI